MLASRMRSWFRPVRQASARQARPALELLEDRFAPAADQGIDFTSPGPTFSSGPFTLGYRFRAEANATVTELGYYDHNKDGFNQSHEVGLWAGSGALLRSAIVTNSNPLTGFFRYVAVAPITLTAGQEYVVGGLTLGGEPSAYDVGGFSVDGRISYLGPRYRQTSVLLFPSNVNSTTNGDFGANLRFASTATPPSITNVANNGPVQVNMTATVTVTATDPDSFDALSYSFDFDNNGTFEVGPQTSNQASHTYTSPGAKTVAVKVQDLSNNTQTSSTVVTVVPDTTPPTVTGTSPNFAGSGSLPAGATSLQISFSEPIQSTTAIPSRALGTQLYPALSARQILESAPQWVTASTGSTLIARAERAIPSLRRHDYRWRRLDPCGEQRCRQQGAEQ